MDFFNFKRNSLDHRVQCDNPLRTVANKVYVLLGYISGIEVLIGKNFFGKRKSLLK